MQIHVDDNKPTEGNAKLCNQLPKAQAMNTFETERAMYIGEIENLRQELERVRLVLDEQILADKAEVRLFFPQ